MVQAKRNRITTCLKRNLISLSPAHRFCSTVNLCSKASFRPHSFPSVFIFFFFFLNLYPYQAGLKMANKFRMGACCYADMITQSLLSSEICLIQIQTQCACRHVLVCLYRIKTVMLAVFILSFYMFFMFITGLFSKNNQIKAYL